MHQKLIPGDENNVRCQFFVQIVFSPKKGHFSSLKTPIYKVDQMYRSIAAFDAQFNFNGGFPLASFAKTTI